MSERLMSERPMSERLMSERPMSERLMSERLMSERRVRSISRSAMRWTFERQVA